MATVNMISIMKKLVDGAAVNKKVQRAMANEALVVFNDKKDELIKAFNEHDVTQELEGSSDVRSHFLPHGNLFSFIGFFQGDKPADKIRALLKDGIRLILFPRRKILKRNSVTMEFTVNTPSLQEFWSATPYPDDWKTGSWLKDLERSGIPYFEFYVFSFAFQSLPESRSGRGLQLEDRDNSFDLGPIKYLEALLKDFKKKVSR